MPFLSEAERRTALQLARKAVVEAVSHREDSRFTAMQAEQLGGLAIEISLLSPPELMSPEAIEMGRHGLLIVLHAKRGLLLPQVAIEHHLTREQFLEETSRKAGLHRDAWRDAEARLFGFTCEVFSESPLGGI